MVNKQLDITEEAEAFEEGFNAETKILRGNQFVILQVFGNQ